MANTHRSESAHGVQQALQTELDMLEAMYQEQVRWQADRRELSYTSDDGRSAFTLRLPHDYLQSSLPETLTATVHKLDVRNDLQARVKQCDVGVEILDLVIDQFRELSQANVPAETPPSPSVVANSINVQQQSLTVIVWLHHLLNTNKRKQALSPPLPGVSGVTKPGYPGVLVYSGPAKAVSQHVRELKSLNWQAFQIRLEVNEEWRFAHGDAVVEVESMAEVVSAVGSAHKQDFLQAMNIA